MIVMTTSERRRVRGQRVKNKRNHLNISQADFANRMTEKIRIFESDDSKTIHPNRVVRIENGEAVLEENEYLAIAQILDVDVEYLRVEQDQEKRKRGDVTPEELELFDFIEQEDAIKAMQRVLELIQKKAQQ